MKCPTQFRRLGHKANANRRHQFQGIRPGSVTRARAPDSGVRRSWSFFRGTWGGPCFAIKVFAREIPAARISISSGQEYVEKEPFHRPGSKKYVRPLATCPRDRLQGTMRSIWEQRKRNRKGLCAGIGRRGGSRVKGTSFSEPSRTVAVAQKNNFRHSHIFLELFPFCTTAAAIGA